MAKKKRRSKHNKPTHQIKCDECGKIAMKSMSNARFCSDACRAKNDRDKKRALIPDVAMCYGCKKPFTVAELSWITTDVKPYGIPLKSEHLYCADCGKQRRIAEAKVRAKELLERLKAQD